VFLDGTIENGIITIQFAGSIVYRKEAGSGKNNTKGNPQPDTFTITFDSNGGSDVQAITKKAGESITAPSAPTRTGYTFSGWYTDNGTFENEYTFGTMPAQNLTLFAKWTEASARPAYTRMNATGEPDESGDYILFGEYPQTIKAADVTITATTDSRGYYLGSDGNYYARFTANTYNPSFKFTNGETIVNGEGYYFKVEPLKWRILEESGGKAFLLSESIITGARFDASSNNYKESEIRAWLNCDFINIAFTEGQTDIIQTVTVDNSVNSTGYNPNVNACEDTEDKVFVLSYRNVVNTQYGFNSKQTIQDSQRRRPVTDFARATGALINEYGIGWWWLRSPDYDNDDYARIVDQTGQADLLKKVSDTRPGLVPALWIQLSDEN